MTRACYTRPVGLALGASWPPTPPGSRLRARHYEPPGGRTGLFELAGAVISLQPTRTLLLCHGVVGALLGHRLLWPLPALPPHNASGDPRGSKRAGGMAQIGLTGLALDGAHPGLWLRRALRQTRGGWPQQHARRRAAALPGSTGMAGPQLCATHGRMIHQAVRGHRRCSARAGCGPPPDRPCAQPVSQRVKAPMSATRVTATVHGTLRRMCSASPTGGNRHAWTWARRSGSSRWRRAVCSVTARP